MTGISAPPGPGTVRTTGGGAGEAALEEEADAEAEGAIPRISFRCAMPDDETARLARR
jgi:hypothetical protein